MWTRRRVREKLTKIRNSGKNSPAPKEEEKVEDLVAFGGRMQLFQGGVKVNLLITAMQFFDALRGRNCLLESASQIVTQHDGFRNFFHGFAPILALPLHHSICFILADL